MNKKMDRNVIFIIFPILILLGKVIRYTLMKNVLVDTGIGYLWLDKIVYGTNQTFQLLEAESTTDTSGNAIWIYQMINIFKLTTYIDFEIYISFIYNIILIVLLTKVDKAISVLNFIFIALSVAVLNIFDFTLAKEPIQMMYFIFIYIVLLNTKMKPKIKNILTMVIIAISAISFRKYYFLVIFFMILAEILIKVFVFNKKKVRIVNIIAIFAILGFVYFVLLNILKSVMPTDFKELIRVRTRDSIAASGMKNILPSDNLVLFSVDYVIMIFRMIVPVELILLGVKYIPYILYQLIITFFIVKTLKNVKKNKKIVNIALYLYIGFLCASASFEPDFGSWVRHEAVLFPVFLFIAEVFTEREVKN